jgi:hypothetical protein
MPRPKWEIGNHLETVPAGFFRAETQPGGSQQYTAGANRGDEKGDYPADPDNL